MPLHSNHCHQNLNDCIILSTCQTTYLYIYASGVITAGCIQLTFSSFCPAILRNDLLLLDYLTLLRLQVFLLPMYMWLPVCHITHGLVTTKHVFLSRFTAALVITRTNGYSVHHNTHTHTHSKRGRWTTSMYMCTAEGGLRGSVYLWIQCRLLLF